MNGSHSSPRHRRRPLALLLAAAFAITACATAHANSPDTELVAVGGINDLRHHEHHEYAGIQVRFGSNWRGIHPYGQAVVSGHGSDYAGAGLLYTFSLPRSRGLTIGSGPNWFRHDALDPNLGSAIEFSSWIELSVPVGGRVLGIDFSHVSNAHLGRINPGSEGIGLSLRMWTW